MIVLIFLLALGNGTVQPARSATDLVFNVDSTADNNDYAINSVCSVGAITGGPCTLRAAIAEANENGVYGNITINIPAGTYNLTIPPVSINDITSGDLDFPVPNPGYWIRLVGTGAQPAVIDANQLDRVFDIGLDVNIQMENIVIKGGLLSWTGTADFHDGAGILNLGTLMLNRVVIEENEARCGQETCVFNISGGGILNVGTMTIVDSTIRNNKSVVASAITHAGSGMMFIKNSTISGNQAEAFVIDSYAHLHIRNSTISGNTAAPAYIAGIRNNHTLIVESSTFANPGRISSIYNTSGSTITIHDSILRNTPVGGSDNCSNLGTWISDGYNIYSDDTCPANGAGDYVNTDPMLGPLGNWGGPTLTMPLLVGSPAENHRPGNCINIPELPALPPLPLTEDQRHYGRTDGMCDTGAFEGVMDIRTVFLPIIFR
jgi:CSLREA domain-containing protein